MSRDSRTILRFGVTGSAVAALGAALFFAYHTRDNWIDAGVMLVAFVLCPGLIPFVWAAGIEMEIPGIPITGLVVIAMNFVLYAAIGAAYTKLRSWREGTSTTN
jgi:hypothetical protein